MERVATPRRATLAALALLLLLAIGYLGIRSIDPLSNASRLDSVRIYGPHVDEGGIGLPAKLEEPHMIVGGIIVQNLGDEPVVIDAMTVTTDSSRIRVLAVAIIDPMDEPGTEMIGALGCHRFPPGGWVTHSVDGFVLGSGREAWPIFQIETLGDDPGALDEFVVTYRDQGRPDGDLRRSSAELDIWWRSGYLADCPEEGGGTRTVKEPENPGPGEDAPDPDASRRR